MLDKIEYRKVATLGLIAEFSDHEMEAWSISTRIAFGEPQILIRHPEGGMPLHLDQDGARALARILEGFAATGKLSREGRS